MPTIAPARYRTVVLLAGLALAGIVLTGAAVRLTQAGLGCENWPACSEDRFVPEWSLHPWIEFGNRLLSGVVAVAVAVAVLTAYKRSPRRDDLIRWSWGLVVGVVAQIVVGGVTVKVDLHPALVGTHYILSMVLLWNAIVLWVRAGAGGPSTEPLVPDRLLTAGRVMVAAAAVVLLIGTLVTGTGPHSGDSRADRLGFDLTDITRAHSVAVWCFLLTVVVVTVGIRRTGRGPLGTAQLLVAAVVAQGGIGYLQFATGVPAGLVELHILGSIVVWCLTVLVHLRLWDRPPLEAGPLPTRPVEDAVGDRSSEGLTSSGDFERMGS